MLMKYTEKKRNMKLGNRENYQKLVNTKHQKYIVACFK